MNLKRKAESGNEDEDENDDEDDSLFPFLLSRWGLNFFVIWFLKRCQPYGLCGEITKNTLVVDKNHHIN